MLLLDTNVVSELRNIRTGKADLNVARWAEGLVTTDLYLSVITLQELEMGVLLCERRDPAQGALLRVWLDEHVLPAFEGRILPIDSAVAKCSASLHVPDPRPVHDAFIAATALVHGMTVVTRNVADFLTTGVGIINPWDSDSPTPRRGE
jgi:predicted nucleic acid-binding protein